MLKNYMVTSTVCFYISVCSVVFILSVVHFFTISSSCPMSLSPLWVICSCFSGDLNDSLIEDVSGETIEPINCNNAAEHKESILDRASSSSSGE